MDSKFNLPIIILAAGESKRMQSLGYKALLEFKGEPFLHHQIRCLEDIGFKNEEILVVLSNKNKEKHIQAIPYLFYCINEKPKRGAFSSIQCGLKKIMSINEYLDGVFILPVDTPCPKREVWQQLATNLFQSLSDGMVSIPEYLGKKGHPVLLQKEFITYLLSLPSNKRLDYEIHNQKKVISKVDDEKVTLNINTPQQWKTFKEKYAYE